MHVYNHYSYVHVHVHGMVGTEGWVSTNCLSFLFFSFLFLFHSTTSVLYTCTFMYVLTYYAYHFLSLVHRYFLW